MNNVEIAVDLFSKGFVCSQAILASYSEKFGLNKELALKLATPFGGGIARKGEICGAVNGAIMVMGLKFGVMMADDRTSRENCYRMINTFINKFESKHNSIICRELLGLDISDPKEYELIREKNLFTTLCPQLVKSAAELLKELS